ncbi:MAG: hypothetical protein GX344_02000 [Intrasporangiaceae bacterium]|nr:hypothetical protein [Intrasporangiaceae bacterium]
MTEDAPLRRRRPEERDRSAPWIAVIIAALAVAFVLFLLLNGRDDEQDTASPSPAPTATETLTETVTEEPTEPTSEPSTRAEEPTTTDATQATTGPSATPTETDTAAATSAPEPTFAAVDPAAFHDEGLGAYFFTALGEQLRCGLFTEGDTRLSGCQATVVVPSLPECDSPESNAPIVTLGETGPAFPECTAQGIFVVEETPELAVGQSLTVDTITCSRDEEGISCYNEETGYGFRASLEEFTAVP